MPKMDGITFLTELQSGNTAEIDVIMDYRQPRTKDLPEKKPCPTASSDYIIKPFYLRSSLNMTLLSYLETAFLKSCSTDGEFDQSILDANFFWPKEKNTTQARLTLPKGIGHAVPRSVSKEALRPPGTTSLAHWPLPMTVGPVTYLLCANT